MALQNLRPASARAHVPQSRLTHQGLASAHSFGLRPPLYRTTLAAFTRKRRGEAISAKASLLKFKAMKLYQEKVNHFLSLVPSAVEAQLVSILAKRNDRTMKVDGSYVTTGDLQMQDLLIDLIQTNLPSATVVSEEMEVPGPAVQAGLCVVVDPIDGTENFTSGLAEWGVSISCYDNGRHVGSLLGCPELRQWTQTGEQPHDRRFSSRIRGLSSSLSKRELAMIEEGFEYRIIGCCVYNMLAVVRGAFHSFENPKGANAWDILAGLNLALERGLEVTVEGKIYAGEYLTPDRKYRFKVQNR